jgi:hypothetical protein
MSTKAFDKIAEGLIDAIAIAKGKVDPAAYQVHVPARFGQSEPAKSGKAEHLSKSEPVERPPHPDPLPASGEREKRAPTHSLAT